MTSIVLTVTGAQAWASVTGPLTSGMVGIPITIEYDEVWDGLTKNLMCRCSPWESTTEEIRTILNVGENAVVAHEVMQPDMYLYLGVEGFHSDGTLVIPTTWARCGKIEYGANTCEDLSADPELPIWNQLQTEVEQIKRDGDTQEQIDEIQAYVQSASQAANSAEKSKSNATAASNLAISNANLAEIYMKQAQTSAENARNSASSAVNLANGALQAQRAAEAAAARAEDAVGSLQDPYELPIGGDELGGVKNGGNVIINADGTMTAPDHALSDEQVRTALDGYIADNPEAIAAGATPEQAAQIEFATATDEALFATLETGSLYEINLSGCAFTNTIGYQYVDGATIGNIADDRFRRLDRGYIHLQAGDVLITNADTFADNSQYDGSGYWPGNTVGSLVWRIAGTAYPNNGYVSACMFGLGKFNGLYRIYQASATDEYLRVAYRVDGIDYTPRFFVARSRTGAMPVPLKYSSGYIKPNTYEVHIQAETEQFATGYGGEVVSDLITVSAPGKDLLVRNVKMVQMRGSYCWVRYDESGAWIDDMTANLWGSEKDYFIVPLVNETEYIRLNWLNGLLPWHMAEALVVDAEYLVHNGYAERVVGKTMAMFGDSYVAGYSIGNRNTWHNMFAKLHQMQYTDIGTNGIGLVKSPNLGNIGLIDKVDTLVDADYIGVICGRNDYSTQAPIGTNDDVSTPDVPVLQRTFKGGLNYLCQYLVENFPGRKVFFLTPWFFPSRTDIEETHKPQEYIDAILEITGLWGIPCFDAARRSGIHVKSEAFRSQYFLSADDVSHLNETGAKLMMDNITGWMLGL